MTRPSRHSTDKLTGRIGPEDARMMTWFAYQRGLSGNRVPVAFAEHPSKTPSMAHDLIRGTLRAIPPGLGSATLAELAAWDAGYLPDPDKPAKASGVLL